MRDYPHQMSGGMRQRVMIGMALSCNPKLLIADEPTTALDVTVQAQILELMKDLREQLGMAILLITHDLGVVAEMVDEVAVMYAGKIVERGPVKEIFATPAAPVHGGAAALDPAARDALHDAAQGDPRHGAEPARLADRLPVRAALRLRLRPLPRGAAAAAPRRRAGVGVLAVRERPPRDEPDRHRLVSADEAPRRRPTRRAQAPADDGVLLSVRGLKKYFPVKQGSCGARPATSRRSTASTSTSAAARRVGLVGESGLRQVDARPHDPPAARADRRARSSSTASTSSALSPKRMKQMRRHMQIVFQDSVGSLDPRMKVGDLIARGPRRSTASRRGRSATRSSHEMLERVGMPPEAAGRYPHQFSGGQRQRIGLARALVLQPKLVVADEPVSALDVSIQSQVLNLLVDLKQEFDLTYVFVAHDLAVVGYISDRVAVMYLGRIVEIAPSDELFARPLHPYTMALLSANPEPDPGPQEQPDRAHRRRAEPDRPAVAAAASAPAARSRSRSAPRSIRRSRITATTIAPPATSPARRSPSRSPHAA